MRLTAKELEQMKSVDIGAVAPESLPDVSGMAFDTSLPRMRINSRNRKKDDKRRKKRDSKV